MIKIEQYRQKYCERYGNEDVAYIYIPKVDEPATILSGKEGFTCRQGLELDTSHSPNVDEAGEEDYSERSAIVFDELPHVALEERTTTDDTTQISCTQDQKSHGDG